MRRLYGRMVHSQLTAVVQSLHLRLRQRAQVAPPRAVEKEEGEKSYHGWPVKWVCEYRGRRRLAKRVGGTQRNIPGGLASSSADSTTKSMLHTATIRAGASSHHLRVGRVGFVLELLGASIHPAIRPVLSACLEAHSERKATTNSRPKSGAHFALYLSRLVSRPVTRRLSCAA